MPQVRFAPAALRDLERLRDFLRPKNQAAAAKRAATATTKVSLLPCWRFGTRRRSGFNLRLSRTGWPRSRKSRHRPTGTDHP
jgi:plasmid stabilization system protein ParE